MNGFFASFVRWKFFFGGGGVDGGREEGRYKMGGPLVAPSSYYIYKWLYKINGFSLGL